MSEINQVEVLIKPQVPKVIDNQQVLVYIPATLIATVSDDFKIDYGKLILNFNLERGTGINAAQMRQDGDSGVFDFTGKNPNATELDPTLTGNISYGATGNFAASFGGKSSAQGKRSFTAGTTTIAKGNYSAAFGDNSVALGHDSFVAGYQNTAKGMASFASGSGTQALGDGSAAFGDRTIAKGTYSAAFGGQSESDGKFSFVAGTLNKAKAGASFASGTHNVNNDSKYVTPTPGGGGTTEPIPPSDFDVEEHYGETSHTEGAYNSTYGFAAHAEGLKTSARGHYSHAEGTGTVAAGETSHAEGRNTQANGNRSHAEGDNSKANGVGAHAENNATANADYSHAEGSSAANGKYSHAEGKDTNAIGESSHAQGSYSKAVGSNSTALGTNTTATGRNSFAGGNESEAVKNNSFVHGFGLKSNQENQTVVGYYNKADSPAIFEVGNGTGNAYDTRKNAFEVLHDGRAKVQSAPIDGDDVVRLQDISSIGGSIDADTLNGLLKAGDGISIGKTTAGEKVEIKIDKLNDFLLTPLGKVMGVGNATRYLGFTLTPDPKIKELTPVGVSYYTFEIGAPGNRSIICKDNLRTIFGNQSLVGAGNIDLYRHNICFTSADQDKLVKIRFIVLSSNNLKVDSLTDLKTLLGNTFTYPVNGAAGDNKSVYEITETGYKAGATPYMLYDIVTAYPAGTWTDDVKTV